MASPQSSSADSSQPSSATNLPAKNSTDNFNQPLPGWAFDHQTYSAFGPLKPVWYLQIDPSHQNRIQREINLLQQELPGLTLEQKWDQVEIIMRHEQPELFFQIDLDNSRVKRLTDPNIFAGCHTEEERKAALVGNRKGARADQKVKSKKEENQAVELGNDDMDCDEERTWQMVVDSCENAMRN